MASGKKEIVRQVESDPDLRVKVEVTVGKGTLREVIKVLSVIFGGAYSGREIEAAADYFYDRY